MSTPSSSIGSCHPHDPFDWSSDNSREMTPEYDPVVAAERIAPPQWDAEEFDFYAPWSEDNASMTEGEDDLRFLLDGELEEDDPSDFSWDRDDSSEEDAEEDADSDESVEDCSGGDGADDEGIGIADIIGNADDDDDDDGHDGDDDDGGDDGNDDSSSSDDDDSNLPKLKRRRFIDAYYW